MFEIKDKMDSRLQRIEAAREELETIHSQEELLDFTENLCMGEPLRTPAATLIKIAIILFLVTTVLLMYFFKKPLWYCMIFSFFISIFFQGCIEFFLKEYSAKMLEDEIVLKAICIKYKLSIDTQLPDDLRMIFRDIRRGHYSLHVKLN